MISILVFALLVLFGFRPVGQASTGVAIASRVATPIAVCVVQPRTLGGVNEIGAIAGTPVPGTPALDDTIPYVKPDGTPATGRDVDGITATIEQFVACVNEGDYLRFLALFSDDFIRGYAEEIGVPIAEDDPLLTPTPADEGDRASVATVTDVIELSDGRISALVTLTSEVDAELAMIQLTFSYDQDKERWLIDSLVEVTMENGATAWTLVQGDGYEGVIVPAEQATEFTSFFISEPVEDSWTPTEEDIAALEQDLPSYLQTMAAVTPGVRDDFVDRLPAYKRQYVGLVQGGRTLILVNATCAGDDMIWRTQPVIVMDGGDCFFRVTYDPTSGNFENFEVNGEA